MWLCQFDISVIFFYYASTFPSGNAALNTKRTTGPAMINCYGSAIIHALHEYTTYEMSQDQLIWKCHYKILWNICQPYHQ